MNATPSQIVVIILHTSTSILLSRKSRRG